MQIAPGRTVRTHPHRPIGREAAYG